MTEKLGTSDIGRFASLLSGKKPNMYIWDTAVLENTDYVVSPTRGSIVADWLLLLPKKSALNFAEICRRSGSDPLSDAQTILNHFGVSNYIWFEHGAANNDSEIGCGVDYAHLHLIASPKFSLEDFRSAVEAASSEEWCMCGKEPVYETLDPLIDYYVFGDAHKSYCFTGSSLGRQFFRKVIASLVGKTKEWDYNLFDHLENVKATVSNFSRFANAA